MGTNTNSRRNIWLLASLGLVLVFYFGDMGYRKFYEEPTVKNERLKGQLNKKLKSMKGELARSSRLIGQLEELEQKSLPWDSEMARSRYQAWLLQLAEDAKLEGISVNAGEPVPVRKSFRRSKKSVELYKRYTFSLRGRGGLNQVTSFLYEFYRGGHLHKVRTLNLNPVGQGQTVDMNVSIEAIALPNADREAELTTLVSEELAGKDVRDYQLIARRNFFGRGGAKSSWRQISLSAVTSDAHGVGEAWFRVAGQSDTIVLQVGDALSQPSFDVLVVALDDTGATVNVDGQLYRVPLGKTLADAIAVE